MNWKKYLARFILFLWLSCIAFEAYNFREELWVVLEVLAAVTASLVLYFGTKLLAEWVSENI